MLPSVRILKVFVYFNSVLCILFVFSIFFLFLLFYFCCDFVLFFSFFVELVVFIFDVLLLCYLFFYIAFLLILSFCNFSVLFFIFSNEIVLFTLPRILFFILHLILFNQLNSKIIFPMVQVCLFYLSDFNVFLVKMFQFLFRFFGSVFPCILNFSFVFSLVEFACFLE